MLWNTEGETPRRKYVLSLFGESYHVGVQCQGKIIRWDTGGRLTTDAWKQNLVAHRLDHVYSYVRPTCYPVTLSAPEYWLDLMVGVASFLAASNTAKTQLQARKGHSSYVISGLLCVDKTGLTW